MNLVLNSKTKLLITLMVIVVVLGFTLWEYFNGGVISHHFFGDKNMPSISNWWGLLSISVVTWLSLAIIQKRKHKTQKDQTGSKFEIVGFMGGLLFGIAMTILFYNGSDLLNYLLLLTFVLAFFIPIYKPEYYLGFILSTIYGFGGILPVVIGLFLMAIYAIQYLVIRKAFLFMLNKIKK